MRYIIHTISSGIIFISIMAFNSFPGIHWPTAFATLFSCLIGDIINTLLKEQN